MPFGVPRAGVTLAVSGATRCRYCAYFHTEAARLFRRHRGRDQRNGADRQEHDGWSTYLNTLQFDYDAFTAEFDLASRQSPEGQLSSPPDLLAGSQSAAFIARCAPRRGR
jgi:hypothetical protein